MRLLCIILIVVLEMVSVEVGFAGEIRKVKDNGRIVFTNMSVNVFFARAFNNSSSKDSVIRLIRKISKEYDVNPKLVEVIAKLESDYRYDALSSKGAKGVMQLMDQMAKFYGVEDPYNVEENIKGGVKFIKHLISKYRDVKLVVAAYNAGESAVDRYKGIPPFKETREYVKRFMKIYSNKKSYKYNYDHSSNVTIRRVIKRNGVYTNMGCSLW